MGSQHDDSIKYIDSGKRTERQDTIINYLAEYFDELTGRPLSKAIDAIVVSDWAPPKSALYGTREEKVKYLRDYYTHMVRERYLLPVTADVQRNEKSRRSMVV